MNSEQAMGDGKATERKKVNVGFLLLAASVVTLVVGAFTMETLRQKPGIEVSRKKIGQSDLDAFRHKLARMVRSYTVRREGGKRIVHPPPGSDIYLLARNYDWGNFILELEKGKTYRLHLTSLDLRHAIVVRELGLMNRIKSGEIKTIIFAPRRAGRFRIVCGEWCGPGHAGMVGTIIVVPTG